MITRNRDCEASAEQSCNPSFRYGKLAGACALALGMGFAHGQAFAKADGEQLDVALAPVHVAAQRAAPVSDPAAGLASGQSGEEVAPSGLVEEIQVTGSRIRQTGMSRPTPVTVMQADELGAMAPGNLIDALDQVPQFLNNASPATAASKGDSAGASNANLRGIGSKRTLVLLNGQRVVPSNRLGVVDINLFPESLVERVETVTGGASAVYGTDAVAGVVNFILDTDFTGVKGHAQGGLTSRGDNENYEVGLTAGGKIGERLHIVASADRYEAKRVDNLAGREWFEGWGLVTNPEWTASGGQVTPRLLLHRNVTSTQYTNGGLIDAPGTSIDRLFFLSDGSATPFVYGNPASPGVGTQSQAGGSGYNPYEFDTNVRTDAYPQGTRSGSFIPTTKRSSAFLRMNYELSDTISLYAQGLWGSNHANSPGTLPLGTGNTASTIYRGNPYLPATVQQIMADEGIESFRMQRFHTAADIAQDRMILKNNTYSISTGFDARVGDWLVNGHYQGGWNHNRLELRDFVLRDRLPVALDAVVDPATGGTVCNVTLVNPGGPYDDCVPLNLFGVGNASQEAIEWITDDMFVQANTRQDVFELSTNGEVYEGWGAGPISLAVGASYREQSINHRIGPDHLVDQPPLANDPANGIRGIPSGFLGTDDRIDSINLSNYEGSFNVKELFAETLVPLLSGHSFVEQLNLSLSARWADYSGSGTIWAWKAGLDWQTTNDLRLRGTVSRDVRAGSLEERFDQQGQSTFVEDPELDDLRYTSFQIRGGNPNVAPEKADTITLGTVYQPSYISGLSLSLDWYSIKVKGAIDLLGVQEIVDQCFDVGGESCDRITRDPVSNRITNVQNTFQNLSRLKASGVDLEATYNQDVAIFGGSETLTGRFIGSWLNENSITTFSGVTIDRTGQVGVVGQSYPEFRATANLTYANGPFSLFVQERFIDGGLNDIDYVEGVDIADNTVDSVFYTDLRLSYFIEAQNGGEWRIYLNVTNVFDRNPPLAPSWSSFSGTGTGTNDTLYDVLGRRFVAGLSFQY